MTVLEVDDVAKSFGGVHVLSSVSFTTHAGQIMGLIGPNGAGKTTLVNCITGALRPDRGDIRFLGDSVAHRRPDELSRTGLVRTFQAPRLLPANTALENILVGTHPRGRTGTASAVFRLPRLHREERVLHQRALHAAEIVGCGDVIDVPAEYLSAGQQRLVSVARALASEPRVLILDEPAAGLNDAEVLRLAANLRRIAEAGTAMVVIEHHVDLVMSICDQIAVLADGRIIAQGGPEEVRQDEEVIAAYLGVSA